MCAEDLTAYTKKIKYKRINVHLVRGEFVDGLVRFGEIVANKLLVHVLYSKKRKEIARKGQTDKQVTRCE